jgi:CBS domain-containing protein
MVQDKTLQEIIQGRPVLKVEAQASVQQAARMMKEHQRGAILVENQGRLQGIFTERDMVFRVVAAGLAPESTPISQVMSGQLVVCHPHDTHVTALHRMASAGIRHLPVVDQERVVGMVSRRQLMALDIELMDADIDKREASRLFI